MRCYEDERMIKKADIEMMKEQGTFQLAIDHHCVTGYEYKSADDCYKSYIVKLLKKLEKIEAILCSS